MRRGLLGLIALTCVAVGDAHAVTPQVRRYLNAAATLYENLDYEKALEQIRRAKGKSSGAEDDAAIALYEGIVLSDLGRENEALTAFKTGLSLDPDAKLPMEISPKVVSVFEKARANVKKMLGPQLEEQKRREEEERKRQEAASSSSSSTATTAPTTVTQSAAGPSMRQVAWIPAVGGAVMVGGGAFLYFRAKSKYDGLVGGTIAPSEAASARDAGRVEQNIAAVMGAVGVTAFAAAGAMFAFGGEKGVVAVIPAEGGGFVSATLQF